MAHAVATGPAAGRRSLAAVRAWWRVRHPPPSLAQRLDFLYTGAIVTGIFGLLAYGTARSALAQVVTPHGVAVFGPSPALLAVLVAAQWGAYQGPVVFSVADVAHLLGAPLPRRGLALRRLALALGAGAAAGALVAATVLVGLAGEGRGVAGDRAAGLTVGLAELGVLAVAASWAVQRSARWERAVRRATWPVVLVAAGSAAAARAGDVGRSLALWSGPWGWAVQPAADVAAVAWLAALGLLSLLTAAAAAAALRDAGGCPTERHLRRAEGRASAIASLAGFDARTARQAVEAVGDRPPGRPAARAGRLRAAIAARRGGGAPRTAAILWRDVVAAARAPGRVAEAAALCAAGTALALVDADRPVAVAAAMALVYFGASRVLWPLRAELDVPGRARILLRPRIGRILLAHGALPLAVAIAAAALATAAVALAGGLPAHGAATAVAAVGVAPILTACAAMSARRGGRVPQSLLFTAVAVDPSGGGLAIATWLTWWPMLAAVVGSVPVLVVSGGAPAAPAIAAAWTVAAAAVLAWLVDRDPREA